MKHSAAIALACVVAAGAALWWMPVDARSPAARDVYLHARGTATEGRSALADESRSAAQPSEPSTDAPVPPPAPARANAAHTATLEQCLHLATAALREECLERAFPQTPSLDDLAAWMCESTTAPSVQSEAIACFVARREPAEAWIWLDELQSRCARHRETHFFQMALQQAGARDAEWLRGFERALAPELLFAGTRGEAPVQIAVMLAQNGSEFARFLLESGGRGEFGGTARQIDRAASCSLALQREGEPFYGYLCSVLRSPTLPEDSALGCTLARFFVDPRARPNGDVLAPLLRLSEVLQDRRLRESAALTLLGQVGSEPPPSVDADVWNGLLAQARSVLPNGLR